MVKTGIFGADSPMAGELIRILINHPESDLVAVYAPSLLGRKVASVHHGLIGEVDLNFSDKINLQEIDLLFILDNYPALSELLSSLSDLENLKIISLDKNWINSIPENEIEIGLSEINRKALVRGAKFSYLSSPILVPTLIALVPLAKFLLLNSDIEIEIKAPHDLINKISIEENEKELKRLLSKSQISFNGNIKIGVKENAFSERAQITKISFKNNLSIDELEKIYEGIYDDHNFTFLSNNELNTKEVEGTQKVILYINKPDPDTLELNVISDPRLRGGVGDAVHVMNLFFGLHEKTGLTLKPSRY